MKILNRFIFTLIAFLLTQTMHARIQQNAHRSIAQIRNNPFQKSQPTQECILCKIVEGSQDASIVYQTERAMVVEHPSELANASRRNFLILPKKHISNLAALTDDHAVLVSELFLIPALFAKQYGYENFQIQVNNGSYAGQGLNHLHIIFTIFT